MDEFTTQLRSILQLIQCSSWSFSLGLDSKELLFHRAWMWYGFNNYDLLMTMQRNNA